jgi:hypothetical protein
MDAGLMHPSGPDRAALTAPRGAINIGGFDNIRLVVTYLE